MRLWASATGAPATRIGYYLGELLCKLGRHKLIYAGGGEFACMRDRCSR